MTEFLDTVILLSGGMFIFIFASMAVMMAQGAKARRRDKLRNEE